MSLSSANSGAVHPPSNQQAMSILMEATSKCELISDWPDEQGTGPNNSQKTIIDTKDR